MIYLVRHGQTEFNAARRMQGHLDSPLTALGRAQAQAAAALLAREIGDPAGWRLVSSPLGRTQVTARIVGEALGLPIEIDHRVIEVSCGDWEGCNRDELAQEHPELFVTFGWIFHGPGGETYDQVRDRIAHWLTDLEPEPERRVIVVSHGGAGRVIRGAYMGWDRAATLDQEVPQDAVYRLVNGAIARLDCDVPAPA
jgi:broad specificity phosphatase PhoE